MEKCKESKVEYPLGWHGEEIERLGSQHDAWRAEAHAIWELAGIGPGQTVLDLGSGPGHAALDLARVVGPHGRVLARDRSESFLTRLRAECEAGSFDWIETSLGPVERLDLPDECVDAVYMRWLLCWVDDAREVLREAARCLRSGGSIVIQDYVDWGAMDLLPPRPEFRAVVRACMEQWRDAGFRIDIGKDLSSLALETGLRVESIRPVARIGAVGSPEWDWIGGFMTSHLDRVVASGHLDQNERDAYERAWNECETERTSFVLAPGMIDLVLRKAAPA